MQGEEASLQDWVAATAKAPAPQGGTASDHMDHRALLSSASARQRHDPAAWETAIAGTIFATHRPDVPLQRPAIVLQADPDLGPRSWPSTRSGCGDEPRRGGGALRGGRAPHPRRAGPVRPLPRGPGPLRRRARRVRAPAPGGHGRGRLETVRGPVPPRSRRGGRRRRPGPRRVGPRWHGHARTRRSTRPPGGRGGRGRRAARRPQRRGPRARRRRPPAPPTCRTRSGAPPAPTATGRRRRPRPVPGRSANSRASSCSTTWGLGVAAHGAEHGDRALVRATVDERRRQGVRRPAAGAELGGVAGSEVEAEATVVEEDARRRLHQVAAEARRVRLDRARPPCRRRRRRTGRSSRRHGRVSPGPPPGRRRSTPAGPSRAGSSRSAPEASSDRTSSRS